MLPNKGGISPADSIPDIKTTSKYEPNDILLSNIRPYFCKIWFANREGGCSNDVLVIKAKENYLPKFLYYVLSDQNFFNYDTVTSKGTKMPRGTPNAIMKYLVPDIGKDKQEIIVKTLSAYDNLIENNNKRIKILEQMVENLYKEWFVRFRFPGHKTTPIENGIPKGWEMPRFGEVATLINGRAYLMPELLSEGKYRIVRVGNFSGKDEWFYSDMELDSDKYCEQGDLLYKWACNFGPEIWNEEKVIYHYHIWKVIPGVSLNKAYLYHYLKYSTPLWMGGTNGTAMVHITKESMEKKRIIVPHKSILDKFADNANQMMSEKLSLLKQNQNLIKQRDLLLPRLMSGKLTV